MWELELLSRVVPAFGALARQDCMKRMEDGQNDAMLRNAQNCWQDLVLIGSFIYMSGGEWASGLDDVEVAKLLAALEIRFPKRRHFLTILKPYGTPQMGSGILQVPKLADLASSMEALKLGGYDECYEIGSQSDDQRQKYVDVLGPGISLFRGSELVDIDKRAKFLKRIKVAAKHLSDVYCPEDVNGEVHGLSLSKHPSHGAKAAADKLYKSLQRHWRCNCPRRATDTIRSREARLSLTRYRQFATIVAQNPLASLSFEVVLPIFKDSVEWKVTNFEVKRMNSQAAPVASRKAVSKDLCVYLSKSGPNAQEYFLIEHEETWHMKAALLEEPGEHASMVPLDQLLGDGSEVSYISQCNPREQLSLCYILATSMLYFYPSSWFSTEWTSNMVHFIPRFRTSTAATLTHPYVSIQLQSGSTSSNDPSDRHRTHSHPAILALGIIFLEIASGSRFQRTRKDTPTEQCNEDNYRAWQDFKILERRDRHGRTKPIPSGLREAIRACLKLEPPASFPSNQLAEEGPIRHYILSCIVYPLARELRDGYKVNLSDIQKGTVPETSATRSDNSCDPTISRQSTASIEIRSGVNSNGNAINFALNSQVNFESEITTSFAAGQAACFYRDREEPVDETKVKAGVAWFDWHNNALARIVLLRRPAISDNKRIKIAILDSGINLSQHCLEIYNTEPKIQYRSWVDDNPDWADEVGHGTHLAVLLRKIAPNAIVHVGRVFKKKPTKASAECVAKAVRYAVDEWKVDIIVMSFGYGEEHKALYDAIRHAAYNEVLMFAAACNDGKNRSGGVAWPAQDDSVICVHSGTGNGDPSGFTPEARDGMRVMVLGECVNSASPPHLKHTGDHRLMSGTSCAAPIAAGIAALILDYARGFLEQQEWEKLRRLKSMRRMFASMTDPDSRSEYRWIRHWVWFEPARDEGWIQGEIRRLFSI